jgi:hypothetical protein
VKWGDERAFCGERLKRYEPIFGFHVFEWCAEAVNPLLGIVQGSSVDVITILLSII